MHTHKLKSYFTSFSATAPLQYAHMQELIIPGYFSQYLQYLSTLSKKKNYAPSSKYLSPPGVLYLTTPKARQTPIVSPASRALRSTANHCPTLNECVPVISLSRIYKFHGYRKRWLLVHSFCLLLREVKHTPLTIVSSEK